MGSSTIDNRLYCNTRYSDGIQRELHGVTVDGVEYARTGHWRGHGIFCRNADYKKAFGFSNEFLFVFEDEQKMIPLDEWVAVNPDIQRNEPT